MKTKTTFFSAAVFALSLGLFVLPASSDARGSGNPVAPCAVRNVPGGGMVTIIANMPREELSSDEAVGLSKMREEEKLARDVYRVLFEQWNLPIFNNILQSEQRHMDMVKILLDRYELADPVTDVSVGVFTDPQIQELYDALVARGKTSLVDALQVGATIEDLDIKDLQELLARTDNQDIRTVYQNLCKGSRNHLRAFTSQLSLNSSSYEAQYLTAEEVEAIAASPMERGMVNADGVQVSGPGAGRGMGRKMQQNIMK
ncbi:DUF2202 domain-containing protein [Desulfolithobacter sp.]